MPNFNFSVLNDKELEELAADLLNKKFNTDFQTFKSGKDKGVDLRISNCYKTNYKIVQVKHYLKTGIKPLINQLKKNEVPKVKELNPDEYWFVTSLELSPSDKEQICALFKPYIPSTNYVFGQEDLTKYLNQYPAILKQWFKLWLTSSAILQTIFNNAIEGRSQFYSEKILKKIKLYVATIAYNDAIKIVQKNHYVLISGQPGVGKTTLADMLSYNFLAKGYKLYYIDKDIREAESAFDRSDDEKQLFYFDDFLGSNYLEIINPKSTEAGIVNFLERIRSSKNKYLVLTTRTTILNTALTRFEKLKRSRIDFVRREIVLGDYNEYDKALILYNHLFQAGLKEELISEVFRNKNYWRIIRHKSYNPRLIEFFTNPYNLSDVQKGGYLRFILYHLNHPHEIWNHSFRNQLSDGDRLLVLSLFTLPSPANFLQLELVYSERLDFETAQYGFRPDLDSFETAVKRLLDGYIVVKRDEHKSEVDFINPSVRDFVIGFLQKSKEERRKLVRSCSYIEQIETVCLSTLPKFGTSEWESESQFFARHLLENLSHIKSIFAQGDERLLKIAAFLSKLHCTGTLKEAADEYLISVFDEIGFRCEERHYLDYMVAILSHGTKYEKFTNAVIDNWEGLINSLFRSAGTEDHFDRIIDLFDDYDQVYLQFLSDYDNRRTVQKAIDYYVDEATHQFVADRLSSIYDLDDVPYVKQKVAEDRAEIYFKYDLDDDNYSEHYFFCDVDFNQEIKDNLERKNQYKRIEKPEKIKLEKIDDPESKIDELFS